MLFVIIPIVQPYSIAYYLMAIVFAPSTVDLICDELMRKIDFEDDKKVNTKLLEYFSHST